MKKERLSCFVIRSNSNIIDAFKVIDANRLGFAVVLDEDCVVLGVVTDGDLRRALIEGHTTESLVGEVCNRNAKYVSVSDDLFAVIDIFKNQAIKFLPIIDEGGHLLNIITKSHLHALLLQDIHADLNYDFLSLDTSVVDHEIFQRPWGYYKTTVMNDYFQAKIISVEPGGKLSLQSHNHREEHWIVVHGTGTVQLDSSILNVGCGSRIFIPKGCKHRLTNTDAKESLIITEVQIGDYFGEDDIIRYEDIYGRV